MALEFTETALGLAQKNNEKAWVALSKIWLARISATRGSEKMENPVEQIQEERNSVLLHLLLY